MFRRFFLATVSVLSLSVGAKPAHAVPVAILGPIAIFAAEIGLSTAAITGLLTGITTAVTIGVTTAINFGVNALLAPKPPRPEERQAMFRDANRSRERAYGRIKKGGTLVFLTKKNGSLYRVVAFAQGPIDAVEEFWVDDHRILVSDINAAGEVLTGKLAGRVNIQWRLGGENQLPYADLIAAAPGEWTAAHQGNGVFHALIIRKPIAVKDYQEYFPRGESNLRAVFRGAKVFDPRDNTQNRDNPSTWKWTENLPLCALDHLTHKDGARVKWEKIVPMLSSWIDAANISDNPIPLKGGGTVARYKVGGFYDLIERPADVMRRFTIACAGEYIFGRTGGIGFRVASWTPSTFTLDGKAILDTTVARGKNIRERANTIRVQYMSPAHDYSMTDAEPWVDSDDVSIRGEQLGGLELLWVPNINQASRLAKLRAVRSKPKFQGTTTCNMYGMGILGEKFITYVDAENAINETVEITSNPDFVLDQNSTLTGLQFSFAPISEAAFSFDAETETLDAPPVKDPISIDVAIPDMDDFDVAVEQRIVAGGQSVAVAVITWTDSVDPAFEPQIEYKLASEPETSWIGVGVAADQARTQTGVLIDGANYVARGRFTRPGGSSGNWTTSFSFTAVADLIAPTIVTAVSATGGVGTASVFWTSPNDAHYVKALIYRNTTASFSGSAFVGQVIGPASTAQSATDSGLAAGTYYYFVKASNGSNVASAEVGASPVTVT